MLALAKHYPFARKLVNSGRLSVPSFLTSSLLNTPDTEAFEGNMVPGAPMDDAPVQVQGQEAWLLDQVGKGFACLLFADAAPSAEVLGQLKALQGGFGRGGGLPQSPGTPCGSEPLLANARADSGGSEPLLANAQPIGVTPLIVAPRALDVPGVQVIVDAQGWIAKRYDGKAGTTYLLRPDQHVAARWRQLNAAQVEQAVARATANA